MRPIRPSIAIIVCILLSVHTFAIDSLSVRPRFVYDVDLLFDFDNREVYHPYEPSQTIFGVRLTPTIGVEVADSLGGAHRLMAGVSYLQPFGAGWRSARVCPTLYYRYSYKGVRVHAGFVPYRELYAPLPDYLMSDSMRWAYPNIQGLLAQYRDHRGYVEVLCDWRGMMSDTVREAFRLIADGRYRYRWLYLGGIAQMNHLSHSERVLGVCDDVTMHPYLGVDMADFTPLDELSLTAGYLLSWQRDRRAEVSQLSHSLEAELGLRWRWVGVHSQLHYGGDVMPLYAQYGPVLNQGDPRYRSRLYSRTDVRLYLQRSPYLTAYAGWSLLYTEGYKLGHQQQVVCQFNLEECVRRTRARQSIRR